MAASFARKERTQTHGGEFKSHSHLGWAIYALVSRRPALSGMNRLSFISGAAGRFMSCAIRSFRATECVTEKLSVRNLADGTISTLTPIL
jgi:hypothetical protein